MKKIKILLILLFIPIILSSCDKKEYGLIELTSEELINNMISGEKDFIFAIVDYSEDNTDQFLKDLADVSSSAKINIYYIDYIHMDEESAGTLLFYTYSTDFSVNAIHAIQDSELIVSKKYTNFKDMYTTLKEIVFTDKLDLIDNKTKQKYIEEANKLYQEEKYAEAHNQLCKAWNLPEAKKIHEENDYYHLINLWEHFKITDEEPAIITYRNLYFYSNSETLYRIKETAEFENFEKPTDLTNYEELLYKIEDNIIYTKVSENSKYKATYEIESVNEYELKIIDLETDTKYTYNRRS